MASLKNFIYLILPAESLMICYSSDSKHWEDGFNAWSMFV